MNDIASMDKDGKHRMEKIMADNFLEFNNNNRQILCWSTSNMDLEAYYSAPVKPVMEMKVLKCCCNKLWRSNVIPVDRKSSRNHYPIVNGLYT